MKATDKLTHEEQVNLKRTFCDGCEADISTTSWSHEERLVLTGEAKAPWYAFEGQRGGAMYPESRGPVIGRPHHFCNLNCLGDWIVAKREAAAAHD